VVAVPTRAGRRGESQGGVRQQRFGSWHLQIERRQRNRSPPATRAKGKRPTGMTMILAPSQPWSGRLSLREETTSQTARLRLQIVDRAADQT